MKRNDVIKLVVSILIAQVVGAIGVIFTAPSVRTWYPELKKPSFNPPSSVFGPVWTILFTLMGVALFLVWRRGAERSDVKPAVTAFGIQLGLNALWSFLFFGLKSPFLALIDIGFLWVAILATILLFLPVSVAAGVLLIPYILWVSFAAALNYFIWRLNP
ncbi:MAG TPA: TspO/MBR family protein [Anaerolineae bacterium]|jgi:tryptophan-rich sensory protein|nr:TspO/MBR family protein [Anaerolineae bacterium]